MSLPTSRQIQHVIDDLTDALHRIRNGWPTVHTIHHSPPSTNSDDPPTTTSGHSDPTGGTIERNATSRDAHQAHTAAQLLREARDAAIGAAAAIDRILTKGTTSSDHIDHYCTHCANGPLPPRSLRNGLCQPCNMYHRRTGHHRPQSLIDRHIP